ncbi:VWA domain-containing protein [Sinimarinibacterium sp. CAU 1509]|uniref:VWA domain-containing protein n=1 Tax=Sinimarinibacterium sp. CAU 1509 TaxID=2562283 RepID=UPI0010AB5356|nr:VWA domain-containing protein [Sinimarinibacterium sp. CAU 1509]TJY59917.1 VWA domain-containing protein [Sinimarinibacterium sp. CAU 1509]
MKFFARASVLASALSCLPLLVPAARAAGDGESAILVLDASGSMWGQLQGRTKIELARDAVDGMLKQWPADQSLGLIAYGHRRKGDCEDIEVLRPAQGFDAAAIRSQVNALTPKGMTPISASVRMAAEQLKFTEHKATVILVSDGEETCNADPCALGTELEKLGVDFTAHVIGFDLPEGKAREQLQCLAKNTGGEYFEARDAGELTKAISEAVSASTTPEPVLGPAPASVRAEGPAIITQPVEVHWTGPGEKGDYLAFVDPTKESANAWGETMLRIPTQNGSSAEGVSSGVLKLDAPAHPGRYELRYVSDTREPPVLAKTVVEVSDAVSVIEAPDTAEAGGSITVVARGPADPRHWVGFAPAGSDVSTYLKNYYERPTGDVSTLKLNVPAEPGAYEIRYVLNEGERVLGSKPITVVAAKTSVSGPATVMAGDRVKVSASGPSSNRHWIGFAPAGSGAGAYVGGAYDRPQGSKSELTINTPLEPGAYEYRYVLDEGEAIAASQAVTVTAATAEMSIAANVTASTALNVPFRGPRNTSNWIGFVPRGGDGSEYAGWSYVPAQGDVVELRAPDDAGSWDLVFVVDSMVISRTPVQVSAGVSP